MKGDNTSDFAPIGRRRTLTEEISTVLRERVQDFEPGHRLPSEQQLADSFEVSRTVVREAMSRLKFEGLIETRQGLGAFVAAKAASPDMKDVETDQEFELANVFELRVALEPLTAAMAALRRTDQDLKRLKKRLDALQIAADTGRGGAKADAEFHCEIANATRNPVTMKLVSYIQQTLQESMAVSHQNTALVKSGPQRVQREHHAIYEAIVEQDPAKAAAAAQSHLKNAAGRLSIDSSDYSTFNVGEVPKRANSTKKGRR